MHHVSGAVPAHAAPLVPPPRISYAVDHLQHVGADLGEALPGAWRDALAAIFSSSSGSSAGEHREAFTSSRCSRMASRSYPRARSRHAIRYRVQFRLPSRIVSPSAGIGAGGVVRTAPVEAL